jgi:hypothetical protein
MAVILGRRRTFLISTLQKKFIHGARCSVES